MPIAPVRSLPVQRASPVLPDEIGGDGCVLLMPMNEGTGDPKDYSGYGNGGTRYPTADPPAWVAGRYGKALDFDGVDDYVDCGDPVGGSLDFGTGPMSVEAWINSSSIGRSQVLCKKGYFTSPKAGYELGFYTSDTLWFQVSNGEERKAAEVTPSPPLYDGKWHHLAGVYERSPDWLRLYIDGVLVNSYDIVDGWDIDSTEPLYVGHATEAGYTQCWKGLIDEVRVYNKALTADEIRAHYLGGRLLKQRSLATLR